MREAYAVLKGNSFARSWGCDPTDHDFPEDEQVFSLEAAREIAEIAGQDARIVELHPYPTLFDLAEPVLISSGKWLSNGYALTRAFDLSDDRTRIPRLIEAIAVGTKDRLKHLAVCPPNSMTQGFLMHVFAPESLGDSPYRGQVERLVCVSERYLEQVHLNWDEVATLYLITQVQEAEGAIALYSGHDLLGACMPIDIRGKTAEIQQALDWVFDGEW